MPQSSWLNKSDREADKSFDSRVARSYSWPYIAAAAANSSAADRPRSPRVEIKEEK